MQKRSIKIGGHATSVTLEEPFWIALKGIATTRGIALNHLITEIDTAREGANLSSALRLYVLHNFQQRITS